MAPARVLTLAFAEDGDVRRYRLQFPPLVRRPRVEVHVYGLRIYGERGEEQERGEMVTVALTDTTTRSRLASGALAARNFLGSPANMLRVQLGPNLDSALINEYSNLYLTDTYGS